ncbi:MAG: formylglycine-generating enzyme family protein, partial [Burkholderiaceae bacterium]
MKSKLSNFFALAISAVSFGVISTPPSLAEGFAAGSTFVDCDYCPEMVVVPAGEFVQGSDKVESGHVDEKPQRTVKFARPFAVSKFEATFAQWDACVADGKCPKADDAGFGRGKFPAVNISWPEAKAYADWLAETVALLREAGLDHEADQIEEALALPAEEPVQMAMDAQRAPKGG